MPSSLDRIFSSAATSPSSQPSAGSSTQPYDTTSDPVVRELPNGYKKLASGIVLDATGKPCRQCTSGSAWMSMMKRTSPNTSNSSSTSRATAGLAGLGAAATTASDPAPSPLQSQGQDDCPPNVEQLGRATWTLLHGMAASYPSTASPSMQATARSFIQTFSQLYPCGYCADDFRDWLKQPGNEVRTEGQDAFGEWACRAHNAVNVKLGKTEFDCALWKERWRDGWRDGSCG
ncbi:uncharacterized protein HMPREF1541_03160 [Cyphellophora europaea CBS 101466]|uniref:Sulfhydryl oxidase n=1 Tax=Cyphellophora europaea (strain CBS 101466) TaxID=1220924 RepID=W2RY18_CYPE1|nr:uncharacterized protein HMPREF1541_03160 [Cyphellophora europaea CBS 101466]ETN41225.1 hypothetical protein HMPREF1541_03160 [Cyphellophora europaea CBS 101466]